MSTKPKAATDKTELAARLSLISDDLHEAAGEIEALGWTDHGSQLLWMSAMSSIYAHQLRGGAERDIAQAGIDAVIGDAA